MTKKFFSGFILSMDIDSVNFRAKFINNVTIQKFDKKTKSFVDFPASFVKLEGGKYSDIKVVDKAAELWKGATYIRRIATASHWMSSASIDMYAVTTQKSKFENLKYSKVLGFAEMRNDERRPKFKWLYYLQVKPSAQNVDNEDKKDYKRVGSSAIQSLKKIYKNISLFSAESSNVEDFYINHGFIKDYEGRGHYVWCSSLLKRLKVLWNVYRIKHLI
jgi:hypothetical protein